MDYLVEPHSLSQLTSLPAPPMRIPGVLPERGIVIVQGPPGSGKTFHEIEVALAAATGLPAFGAMPVARPCRVLFVGNDSPGWDIGAQARKLLTGRGLRAGDLARGGRHAHVQEHKEEEQTVEWEMDSFMQITDAPAYFGSNVGAKRLLDVVREGGYELVICDTLTALHEENGNDWAVMQQVMNRVKLLRPHACVRLLHHTPKPTQGVTRNGVDNTSGARPIAGGADGIVEVTRRKGRVRVEVVKERAIRLTPYTYVMEDADDSMRFVMEENEEVREDGVAILNRLAQGEARFKELQAAAGHESPNTTTNVLKWLAQRGKVRKVKYGVYALAATT